MRGLNKIGVVMGFLLVSMYSATSMAKDVPVVTGGNTFQIPIPTGFTPLTEEMKPLYDIKEKLVAPTNRELVALIPEAEAKLASAGKVPVFKRSFSVQVAKNFEGHSLTDVQFAALKSIIRDKNQELSKMAQAHINQALVQQTADINQQMKSNVHLNVTDNTVLPVHDDTPNSISWSMYIHMNVGFGSAPEKDGAQVQAVVTATIAHVHGQVLFFYVTGGQDDLDWTRDAAKQWLDAIGRDNP